MKFNPIKDKKVYEQIIDQIKDMIYEGELKKGDKLPSERTLTDDLKVSRASIREAFSALEMIGLIESRHGEGTFIKENTDENFLKPLSLLFMLEEDVEKELIELRKMIEITGARFAAMRATEENLTEMGKYVQLMEESRGNAVLSREADKGFHYALAKATGNHLVYKLLNSISEVIDIYLARAMQRIVQDEEKTRDLISQHKEIYKTIRNRDASEAQRVMEKHLTWSEDLLEL